MTNIAETLDTICHDHIERGTPITDERLEWLINQVGVLHLRLSEAGLVIAALAVYGESASLPALVRAARSQVDLVGAALDNTAPAENPQFAGKALAHND